MCRNVRQQDISFDTRAKRQVTETAGERIADRTDDYDRDERLGKVEELWLFQTRKHRHQTLVTLRQNISTVLPQHRARHIFRKKKKTKLGYQKNWG